MTKYFHESNKDLAPLFADLLNMAIEFRVAASKSVGLASMRPLRCEKCGKHVALVILGLPFMLLLFRLQAVFLSMIDNWEIIPESPNRYRERISWHKAGEAQVHQLVLGLDMYLGEKDVTHEGMADLLSSIDRGNEHARSILMDALRVAESWVVGHEVFHVCLLAQTDGPFPEFVSTAESNRDVLEYAACFCTEMTKLFQLPNRIAKMWLEEFQADLLACKTLLIAIADRRFMARTGVNVTAEDARFHAARALLNGVAASFETIYWVDIQSGRKTSLEKVRFSSHPPHHVRCFLVKKYVQALIRVGDDAVFKTAELMEVLSQNLLTAYRTATKDRLKKSAGPVRKS
jgi:hypothetical protein